MEPPRRQDGDKELYGNAEVFWSRGYVEVGDCAGTGLAQSIFTLVDRVGDRLQVTIGEEEEDGSGHAKVDSMHLQCRK